MVASVYRGGGESEPSSQVAKIPPALVITQAQAIAEARRTCGVVLFAIQLVIAGAAALIPEMVRKRLPY